MKKFEGKSIYDEVKDFRDGFAAVKRNGKWGFVNEQGEEVIPCKYDDAWSFSEGFAKVVLDGEWGFVNEQGEEVIPCKYDNVWNFSEGFAKVVLDGKSGFVNEQGEEVIPCKYDDAWSFSEGFAKVHLDGKQGYVNEQCEEVVPCKYDNVWNFSEGYAAVKLDGEWGFVNEQGEAVIPCKYDGVWDFSEGYAVVVLDGKFGFVNKQGEEVVPCKYDDAWAFSNGFAGVELDGKIGLVNEKGEEVVPCKYDDVPEIYCEGEDEEWSWNDGPEGDEGCRLDCDEDEEEDEEDEEEEDGIDDEEEDEDQVLSMRHLPDLMAATERLPDSADTWDPEAIADIMTPKIIEAIEKADGDRTYAFALLEYDETFVRKMEKMDFRGEKILLGLIYRRLRSSSVYDEEEGTLCGYDGDELIIQTHIYQFNDKLPVLMMVEVLFSHWDFPFFWNKSITAEVPAPYCYYPEVFRTVVAMENRETRCQLWNNLPAILDEVKASGAPKHVTFYECKEFTQIETDCHIVEIAPDDNLDTIKNNKLLMLFGICQSVFARNEVDWVFRNGKWGLNNWQDVEISPARYEAVFPFSEGYARVVIGNKIGLVCESGKEIIPCNYDDVDALDAFEEGFAKVKLDSKWGLVNEQGEEVVPCKYDYVGWFSEGFAEVALDGKFGKVNTRGEEFWD